MTKIRSIECHNEYSNLWEGKILIQDDNSFEGIINSEYIDIYINGIFENNSDRIIFNTLIPEIYPFHITHYNVSKNNNLNIYTGISNNNDDIDMCTISIKKLNINKQLTEAQTKELEYIIDDYKKTKHERYNEYLEYLKTYSEEKVKKLEKN